MDNYCRLLPRPRTFVCLWVLGAVSYRMVARPSGRVEIGSVPYGRDAGQK